MKKHGYSWTLMGVFVVLLSVALAACGDDEPGVGSSTTGGAPITSTPTTAAPTTTAPGPELITIQEALSVEGPVRVVGAIIATHPEGGTPDDPGEPTIVLASALAESYPPQPGGPTIPVSGLDLDDLVGLSTTVGEADVAPVTWSNYWILLEGTVADGTLEVTVTPTVIQAVTPDLRIRFSVATEPLVSGNSEWWTFDVRNEGEKPLDLTFSSGQEVEVVLSQDGVEKYRWSDEKLFTEAIKTVSLQPGDVYPAAVYDTLPVAPGRYDLTAFMTAKATVDGQEVVLPALEGTLDVS